MKPVDLEIEKKKKYDKSDLFCSHIPLILKKEKVL